MSVYDETSNQSKPEPGYQWPIAYPGSRQARCFARGCFSVYPIYILPLNTWAANNVKIPLIVGHEVSGIVEAVGEKCYIG